MENRGLLFIPDISGFSRFVNAVELEHSRFIIQQLLDVLLRANDSGLQISEIEGDAILFYQFGEPVALRALYTQVEKMGARFSWGRASIASKMRYAFGIPRQGFQRRPLPNAMPARQHT
jgi:hypothetical protein